jgi:hypothetical protein
MTSLRVLVIEDNQDLAANLLDDAAADIASKLAPTLRVLTQP